jgi:hypothetical protein
VEAGTEAAVQVLRLFGGGGTGLRLRGLDGRDRIFVASR